jgi:SAM-dependent methyltransferase
MPQEPTRADPAGRPERVPWAARAASAVHARAVAGRRVAALARALAPLLPTGRVLDIGAGDGQVAVRIQELRPEVAFEGVEVLVRPGCAIPVEPFDGQHLPAGDQSFDACLLVDVLHHCEEPQALLAEAARVGRCVVIKDHVAAGRWDRATLRFMDWVGNRGHGVVLPYHYLSWPGWEQSFTRTGLRLAMVERHVPLYPPPGDQLFGRGLHFVARLEPEIATGGPGDPRSAPPLGDAGAGTADPADPPNRRR